MNGRNRPWWSSAPAPTGCRSPPISRRKESRARVFGRAHGHLAQPHAAGMFLKSTPAASSISAPAPGSTLRDFCAEHGLPPLDEHAGRSQSRCSSATAYGSRRRLVPGVEQVRVRQRSGRPAARSTCGSSPERRCDAGAVVVATGLLNFAHVPDELSIAVANQGRVDVAVSHSSQHRDLSESSPDVGLRWSAAGSPPSRRRRSCMSHGARVHVLVRGRQVRLRPTAGRRRAAQPPAETIVAHGPRLVARSVCTVARRMFRHLPGRTRLETVRTVLGPSGAWWLRPRVEGRVDVRTATSGTGAHARRRRRRVASQRRQPAQLRASRSTMSSRPRVTGLMSGAWTSWHRL